MGTCGSSKERKKTDNPNKNGTETGDIKLKGKKKILTPNGKDNGALRGSVQTDTGFGNNPIYTFRIKDTVTNQTYDQKQEGTKTIDDLFKSIGINLGGDFDIIENGSSQNLNEETQTNLTELFVRLYNKKIPEVIEITYIYKGLLVPQDIIQAYIEANPIIGNPILDNQDSLGIITYEKSTDTINSYSFSSQENDSLAKYNSFTAYCNANGILYLSGGEKEQVDDPDTTVLKYNDFFCINLTELSQDNGTLNITPLPNLIVSRTWHSMIFVPNNYIFIVGGANTNTVEIYDLQTGDIKTDSELYEARGECTLCLANDTYLYAFCGFALHKDYINNIERCNLKKQNRSWDLVDLSKDSCEIRPSFFGVSYLSNRDNNILLIGVNDNSETNNNINYIVKVGDDNEPCDHIEEFSLKNNPNCVYREKLFIPIGNDKAVNIPLIVGEEIKVFIFDMKTGDIEIKFKRESI